MSEIKGKYVRTLFLLNIIMTVAARQLTVSCPSNNTEVSWILINSRSDVIGILQTTCPLVGWIYHSPRDMPVWSLLPKPFTSGVVGSFVSFVSPRISLRPLSELIVQDPKSNLIVGKLDMMRLPRQHIWDKEVVHLRSNFSSLPMVLTTEKTINPQYECYRRAFGDPMCSMVRAYTLHRSGWPNEINVIPKHLVTTHITFDIPVTEELVPEASFHNCDPFDLNLNPTDDTIVVRNPSAMLNVTLCFEFQCKYYSEWYQLRRFGLDETDVCNYTLIAGSLLVKSAPWHDYRVIYDTCAEISIHMRVLFHNAELIKCYKAYKLDSSPKETESYNLPKLITISAIGLFIFVKVALGHLWPRAT